jgi:hypothetical protein
MQLNEQQLSIWKKMVDKVDRCLGGEGKDFYRIVGELEGLMDAAELKDSELVNTWRGLWIPLEMRRAIEGNNPSREGALKEMNAMKAFLLHTYSQAGHQ